MDEQLVIDLAIVEALQIGKTTLSQNNQSCLKWYALSYAEINKTG